jgi:hypothetical protein
MNKLGNLEFSEGITNPSSNERYLLTRKESLERAHHLKDIYYDLSL